MWMKHEVSCFCNLVVQPKDCKNLLEWWKTNEKLFPNVIFLAMQNFRILGAKEKHNNSFLLQATRLCEHHMGTKNLDHLIL
jgi:hypothetical protein